MMLRRAMRVNEPGFPAFAGGVKRSTSAVPSQLFPTKTTGVVVVVPGFGGLAAGAVVAAITATAHASVAASANAPSLVLICRVLPRRPSTALPPGPERNHRNRRLRGMRRLLPVPRVPLRDGVKHQPRLDPLHRVRRRRPVVVELAGAECLETPLHRLGVGTEDHGVLGGLGREMELLRLVGHDPPGQPLTRDRSRHLDPVVADLADVEAVELLLGHLDHHAVDRPGLVLALLDIEAEDPLRPPAGVALEGLLTGQVVAPLAEPPPPVVQPRPAQLANRPTKRHRGALRENQGAVAEEAETAHEPSSRLSCGSADSGTARSRLPEGSIGGSGSSRICAAASWLQSRSRAGQSAQSARCGRSVTSNRPSASRPSRASTRARAASRSAGSNVSRTGWSGRSRNT